MSKTRMMLLGAAFLFAFGIMLMPTTGNSFLEWLGAQDVSNKFVIGLSVWLNACILIGK
jgi:fucose permease